MDVSRPKLNLTKSPASEKDYYFRLDRTTKVGSAVDNSEYNTSIKNQRFGDCTSMATVALMEYNLRRFSNQSITDKFSEKFTYYTTRVGMLQWPANEDSGAHIKDAVASTVRYGTCLETKCPYDYSFSSQPSNDAYQDALHYQSVCYACVKNGPTLVERTQALDECKRLLTEKFGLVAGFVCYENIWTDVDGLIPLPAGKVIGGHAVFICGYDDSREVFKFKNSWGDNWGDEGYGYLPYQYLLTGDMWDIWTVVQQEDSGTVIGVFKPTIAHLYESFQTKTLECNSLVKQQVSSIVGDLASVNSNIATLMSLLTSAQKSNNFTQMKTMVNQAGARIGTVRTSLNPVTPRLATIDKLVTQKVDI